MFLATSSKWKNYKNGSLVVSVRYTEDFMYRRGNIERGLNLSVVNFKHFARNKYSELIRLESCFLGIIFFTSKFPGNSVPNEYFKLLLQKNVMMLVRNKPCKSSTKSNLSFLKYLINEKSIFIKLRKDPFLNRFFKSVL